MKMKTLSFLLIPVLGLTATVSLAKSTTLSPTAGTITLNVSNRAGCPIALAPGAAGSPCTGPKTINSNGGPVSITCKPGQSMYLWYNNVNGAHSSTLQFNHIVTAGYTYFMQSYQYAGDVVSYSVNGGTTLQGANSIILSDDGQSGARKDVITSSTINIQVNGSGRCSTPGN